jgi:N-acetylglucosaminyl-diphospho-decaprenol L-rhamnosyltransferase
MLTRSLAPCTTLIAPPAPLTERLAAPVQVSVCVVNWNCREHLRRCLVSLLNQPQGIEFEVIVVDNASTDGAAAMVARDFPEVRLVRNAANAGFSRGNNQAAALARGDFLFFLNNDTEVPPGCLAEFVDYAEAHPAVGMIGPKLRGGDGEYQINYRRKPTLRALLHRVSFLRWTGLFRDAYQGYRRDTFEPEGTKAVEVLMGAAVFLPRAVFEATGRWDERYDFGAEDLDLSTQVGRRHGVVHLAEVEVLHHGRVSSRENIRFSAPNVTIGYVHYFRKAGVSAPMLVLYKSLVTIDAPVQLVGKLAQYACRRLRGRPAKAAKSLLAARGVAHFLARDLARFWRA